jgi:hypothetical protein
MILLCKYYFSDEGCLAARIGPYSLTKLLPHPGPWIS